MSCESRDLAICRACRLPGLPSGGLAVCRLRRLASAELAGCGACRAGPAVCGASGLDVPEHQPGAAPRRSARLPRRLALGRLHPRRAARRLGGRCRAGFSAYQRLPTAGRASAPPASRRLAATRRTSRPVAGPPSATGPGFIVAGPRHQNNLFGSLSPRALTGFSTARAPSTGQNCERPPDEKGSRVGLVRANRELFAVSDVFRT